MYIQVKIKQKACVDILNEVTKLKAIGNHYKLFFENSYTSNMPFAIFRLDAHPVFTLRALFYQDLFLNFMIVL